LHLLDLELLEVISEVVGNDRVFFHRVITGLHLRRVLRRGALSTMLNSLVAIVEVDVRGIWVEEMEELLEGDAMRAPLSWTEFLHLINHLHHLVLLNSKPTPLVHLMDPFCRQIGMGEGI